MIKEARDAAEDLAAAKAWPRAEELEMRKHTAELTHSPALA